ncbi:PAS domain-containing protein [Roseospira marina]|uniref:histidine kinase n=1 Tax=Roseospira marina TaxID=140057 RepID=A0A5M6IAW4_9PROT|nr:ATP-binding protein [Roseospira marina]KAA5604885.1 PAS domain-containing protein [Roseospira marina]MBB4315222.1 two-component system phosphate regulon sensor histidine kinase PhoR [Roseospira marina]MBB5088222.1 two-component system phosphate regulon sensor histidine kinase PhoR [Roseospira marina]
MVRNALLQRFRTPLPGRLLRGTLMIASPGVALLAVLAVTGVLTPGWLALALAPVLLGGTALMLLPHLRDLHAVERTARALADGRRLGPGPPEIVYSRVARGQMQAVQDLRRACDRRLTTLAIRAESDALVVDSLPDPILLIDTGGAVTRGNAAARALFGRDGVGKPLTLLLRDPVVLTAVEAVLAGGPGRAVQVVLPGAVERDYEVRVGPLAQPDRQGAEVMVSMHDVSKLVRLERMRADFVANASHELRTPLSSLVGFVETLMGPARDDADAHDRFLPIMLEQGRRMQRLVEDLLSLSRIEINEHAAPTDTVPLPELVHRIARSLELKCRAKRCAIVFDLDPGLPPVVGDADQLSQVFQNLLDNAVKYGRPDSTVTVSGHVVSQGPAGMPAPLRGPRRGPCIHIAVRDEGEGIERDHLPRLTERFYRVDRARSRQMGGTGLGLAIVKHVLARHRGLLVPESVVGEGSTFHVYLPLAADAATGAPSKTHPPASTASATG